MFVTTTSVPRRAAGCAPRHVPDTCEGFGGASGRADKGTGKTAKKRLVATRPRKFPIDRVPEATSAR